jgi:3-oxoacyl-[acyl-carrier-protein] synthase II
MARRVVVTGCSVVTALGCEADEFWDAVCAGKSGVGPLRRFDPRDFKVTFGGEIGDFNASEHLHLPPKELKRLDRFCQFALVAADKAIRACGIDLAQGDPYRYGVLIGSGIGGLGEIEEQHTKLFERGPQRVSALMIPKLMVNAASGNVSVRWGLRGPSSAVATACASATNAIGDAFKLIQNGMADVMITGGSEAAVTPMGLCGFARMNALSTRNEAPQQASRPFDRDRDGFVLSEGAGILILEDYDYAVRRGAPILAELMGYGMSADASHITAPDPEGRGAARAMHAALGDARTRLKTWTTSTPTARARPWATSLKPPPSRRSSVPTRSGSPSPAPRASSAICWALPAASRPSPACWRFGTRSRRRRSTSITPTPSATWTTSRAKPVS